MTGSLCLSRWCVSVSSFLSVRRPCPVLLLAPSLTLRKDQPRVLPGFQGQKWVTEIQGSPTLRPEWSGKWGGRRLRVVGAGRLARVGQEGRQQLPLPSHPTPLGCRFPERNLLPPQPLPAARPSPTVTLNPSSIRLYGEWGLFSSAAILDSQPAPLLRPGQRGCL